MVRRSRLIGTLRPNLVSIGIYSFYDKFRLLVSFVMLYYMHMHACLFLISHMLVFRLFQVSLSRNEDARSQSFAAVYHD